MDLARNADPNTSRSLVRLVHSWWCAGTAVQCDTGRMIVDACLDRSLGTFAPKDVCGLAHAIACQRFVHQRFFEQALKYMHGCTLASTPRVSLRAWLHSLVITRIPVPAAHADACLAQLVGPYSRCSPVVAASTLRMLLLANIVPADGAPNTLNRHVGHLLKSVSAASMTVAACQSALVDAVWLIERSPPSWWRNVPPHAAALLEAAKLWHGEPAPLDKSAVRNVERVHRAIERLECSASLGTKVGHFRAPLACPDFRLILDCDRQLQELRTIAGDMKLEYNYPPMVELRQKQLEELGWRVEVVSQDAWPSPSERRDTVHRQEELMLRCHLASALQQSVPVRRRRGFSFLNT